MEYINEYQRIQHRQRVLRDAEKYGASKAARMHGLARKTVYRWKQEVIPRKPGPKGRVRWQTAPKLEAAVLEMRRGTNYGPKRLKAELKLEGIVFGEKAIRGILNRSTLRGDSLSRLRAVLKLEHPCRVLLTFSNYFSFQYETRRAAYSAKG